MPDPNGTVWVDDHFIGGHVALDFCNTVYRRLPELGADLLDSPKTLHRWLVRASLLPESAGPIDEGVLKSAVKLRASLWAAFDAQCRGATFGPDVLKAVLTHARRGAEHVHVDEHGAVSADAGEGAVAALAVSALQLLLSPPSPRARTCDGCGWFFIDTSRGRRRRWCSMKTCGNEHKVARFRAGQHTGT
ncbi:CGNR zinc finger domain-containing protein [Mycobacterium sp. NPDC003323]